MPAPVSATSNPPCGPPRARMSAPCSRTGADPRRRRPGSPSPTRRRRRDERTESGSPHMVPPSITCQTVSGCTARQSLGQGAAERGGIPGGVRALENRHRPRSPPDARCDRRRPDHPRPPGRGRPRRAPAPPGDRDHRAAAGLRGRGLPGPARVRRRRPRRPRPVHPHGPDGRGRVRAGRAEGHAVAPAPRVRDRHLHDRRDLRAPGLERRRRPRSPTATRSG